MNKKLLLTGLCAVGLLSLSPVLKAQTGFDAGNISSILEDNSLRDAFTRYTSVLTFFFPEEATRWGFSSGNHLLNDRTTQTDDQALQAFKAVQNALGQINVQALSPSKRAEYTLLSDELNRQIFALNQNRISRDPLYYAQALDAVYDLLLTPETDARKQRTNLLGRVTALPKVLQQARENLIQAPPELARLAMEKAYVAYLAFDDVAEQIKQGATLASEPRDAAATAEKTIQEAKATLRQLFDFFKELTQPGIHIPDDVRMGDDNYYSLLKNQYQITDKPQALTKQLNQTLDKTQHQLFEALLPFQLPADEEEVTVVEGLNELPQTQLEEKSAKKWTKPAYTAPTANQFYAIANQLESPFELKKVQQEFTKQAAVLSSRLLQRRIVTSTTPLTVRPLVRYFSYQHPYITLPAFNVFWLRLPQGNKLAQQEMLKRDFNEPASKLLISQELVPGRYYQNQMIKNTIRRLFGSPTLANAWTLYALNLTQTAGYLVTDEEQLFLAWQHYLRALSAVVDQRLHTRQYTYEEAVNFLTAQNGFTPEQANAVLTPILTHPGQAVSFVWGAQVLEKAAAPYTKKDISHGVNLLLQVGNVSPKDLSAELKRISKK